MAPEGKAGDFGSRLRQARERRGIGLRDIANETKISMALLEALERNDVSKLPGGIFSRAFVRSYAAKIGLDPEETVEDFLQQFRQESVTVGHASSSTRFDDPEAFESNRRTASVVLTLLGVSVPLVILVVYLGIAGSPRPQPDQVTSPAAPTATPPPAESADTRTPLRVELTAIRDCNARITIDAESPVDKLLTPGGPMVFSAQRSFGLEVNDAGAVLWSVNGAPPRSLGAPGERRSVELNQLNLAEHFNVP